MAMKETERSLRWYFLIAGGVSVVMALSTLVDLLKFPHLPVKLVAPIWFAVVTRLVFGAGFVVAAALLKQALLTGARWIQHMVLLSGLALVVDIIWSSVNASTRMTTAYQQGAMGAGVVGIAIRIAIVAYLYANIRRLSVEARVRTAGTAFE